MGDENKLLVLHEMWVAGASVEDICRRLGMGESTVYKWVRKHHIPARARPQNMPRSEPTPSEIAERARECRERHYAARRAETEEATRSKAWHWQAGEFQPGGAR